MRQYVRSADSGGQGGNALSDAIFVSGGSVYAQGHRAPELEFPQSSGEDATEEDRGVHVVKEKARIDVSRLRAITTNAYAARVL